jgi:gamma-glutamylcyclotransferase (GGCT)/AIG2-like uncharacterized protein YtfP
MLIFVYGTLKSECCNNGILKNITKDEPIHVETVKKFPMYKSDSYYPYLENQPGIGYKIIGEMYDIDPMWEETLDNFEGVPTLYKKGKLDVEFENTIYNVHVYFKAEETKLDELVDPLIDEWEE